MPEDDSNLNPLERFEAKLAALLACMQGCQEILLQILETLKKK